MYPLRSVFRYACLLCLGAGAIRAQVGLEGERQPILMAGMRPVIDGEMDAVWHNAGEHILTKNETTPPDDWFDLFGSWRMLWDEQSLYLFCTILDDAVIEEHGNVWERDGIEFYFDADNSKLPGTFDGIDDIQFRINHGCVSGEKVHFNCGISDCTDRFDDGGILFSIRDMDKGWRLEASVPAGILQMTPESGLDFGFEMQVNDNDSGHREHAAKWWSGDAGTWMSPSLWGTCTLSGTMAAEMLPVIRVDTISVDGLRDPAWSKAPLYTCNHWVNGGFDPAAFVSGWSDVRFQFQTVWDLKNIFCFTRVFDETIVDEHANVWDKDGMEFFFDGDNSKTEGCWDGINDISFWITHGMRLRPDVEFNWGVPYVPWDFDRESLDFVVSDTEDGYTIEFSIPLDELQILPEEGALFGFEIKQNDNDTGEGRESMRQWWGESNDTWMNAGVFGTAMLAGEEGSSGLPILHLMDPEGSEIWLAGTLQTIRWSYSDVDRICLEFSTDLGGRWQVIDPDLPAAGGSYEWTVPSLDSDSCLIRIYDTARPHLSDLNVRPFSITTTKEVRLLSPNGGESWTGGTIHPIQWSCTGMQFLDMYCSYDGGLQWHLICERFPASSLEMSWQVPDLFTNQCFFRITEHGNPEYSDDSDGSFSIVCRGVHLIAPNGGEMFFSGDSTDIRWEYFGIVQVNIWVSYNTGSNWEKIAEALPCTGVYRWRAPYVATLQAMIRVEDQSDAFYSDISDNTFMIKTRFHTDLEWDNGIPARFELSQNHPNPFNPETRIPYTVPISSEVRLNIYNIEGKWICTLSEGVHAVGRYEALWDGRDASGGMMGTGIYLCRMDARPLSDGPAGFSRTRKLFLVK